MSQFEHLFLDPGRLDVDGAAEVLGSVFGLRSDRGPSGALYLGTDQLSPGVGHVGGRIERNPYRMVDQDGPEDFSIYDDLPIVWSLWSDAGWDPELAEQRRRARAVFDLVVAALSWPSVLVHDFEELVATYDPEGGLREFPPGTLSDGRHRHLWT